MNCFFQVSGAFSAILIHRFQRSFYAPRPVPANHHKPLAQGLEYRVVAVDFVRGCHSERNSPLPFVSLWVFVRAVLLTQVTVIDAAHVG